ncbi:LysR family transcriptional regulator [Priestia endophytica]|uniref:LysR family transcriptional regulator n=1 Tax=Priestia endophytica TaxID=135735 RepID=A0AAX1Q6M7_9BACI|nr:LysR family transcriptional regulator [Priestia endophytica]RAS75534.1 LysR family transcriptional regulator [Priestia endophytica]RAS91220.1 LysR family transcriptional regulator [Priestia endophytica]
MSKKDWIILQTVFEEKNITKAAERLYIAQPTLTYRLQQIEKEFDVKLFYRGRKGVVFTEEGELLVRHAGAMLREQQRIEELLWNIGNEVKGTLRLSVSRTYAIYELPQVLKIFNEKFPKVEFYVETGVNADVVQSVYKQDAHIGIVRGDHHSPNGDITIAEENISILSAKEIDLNDLPSMRRISYQTDPALEMVIDNWWKDNFSSPPISNMNVDNVEIAKRMVLNGLGYCIAPSIVLEKNKQLEKGILIDTSGSPITWRNRLLYREELLELAMVKEFVNFIKGYYHDFSPK